jgi:hypothetical protein
MNRFCRLRVGKYYPTISNCGSKPHPEPGVTYLEACDASCAALPCGASEKKERELGVYQVVVKMKDT